MSDKREHWGSKLGFMLTAAGSAIGLGTIWMLPYTMGQNGGGAFIALFLLFNFVIGVPLFIAELLMGRLAQKGSVGSFKKFTRDNSSWGVVGWLCVVTALLVLGWYAVVAGWGINYAVMSLVNAFQGKTVEEMGRMFDVFRASGDLNVLWQCFFLVLTGGIVTQGVAKGIERWSKIMTSGLFIALILLCLYSFRLPGFQQALAYLFKPDFGALSAEAVLKAMSLALFTLSLGYGIMVTYGSYMQKSDDIPKTALIVGAANFVVALLIALMIFPIIFTFGFEPQAGEGLLFKALPYAFSQLPGTVIISFLFFTLLIFAALTSAVSMLEVVVANFIELFGWSRRQATLVGIAIAFFIGLPTAMGGSQGIFPVWNQVFQTSFLETNYIVIDWLLAITALLTALYVGWFLPASVRRAGFCEGSQLGFVYRLWLFATRYVVPIAILLVILHSAGIVEPLFLS